MRVLVLGATGFVGRRVRPALVEAGFTLRLGSRDPGRARASDGEGDWVAFDVEAPRREALEGVDGLVYLVHQMHAGGAALEQREQAAARRVAALAGEAGVQRIVFLGAPDVEDPSHHLAARLATGRALREGPVPCVELQAAMIVGAGSESWWICRDLALRLPAMTLPPWAKSRSEPVAIADVVTALVRSLQMPLPEGSVALALPGPEALSAEAILRTVAHEAGFDPLTVHVPFLTPRISSLWLRFVTRADFGLSRQLVDGLEHDLLHRSPSFWARHPDLSPTPFAEAVRQALAEDEAPPTVWERIARRVGRKLRPAPR